METDKMELWGGVECTINRVGDRYFNQLQRNGHWYRLEDLDRFADLGLRTLRFPLLWESLAPESSSEIDWRWSDARLERLQSLGIRPIVGLLHHGSGPAYTSLVDPAFADKFAQFAEAVARRYPHIDAYTPVNEPLTTARFSGLYGHWYPHGRDDRTFVRTLLSELRGTVLAMRAIHDVNPSAQLVQTDDLGRVYSTSALNYQADFENERRWISWDLLRGDVGPHHPVWSYLRESGASVDELEFFRRYPCPADVVGINYYVTSDRFLDDNVELYPEELHGGNGRQRYADDAAVRARPEGIEGVYARIMEAWQRYRTPIAITEAHLGSTLDEQLRWLMEMWRNAGRARTEGCDVRALTVWALLGSFDWDVLVTRHSGTYEPGAFDLRGDAPRATPIATAIRELNAGREFQHPVLQSKGWWHSEARLRMPGQLTGTGTVLD
ncbi:MAG: family 1 glycosylhydrolase [Chthoniobacterales bacterium]